MLTRRRLPTRVSCMLWGVGGVQTDGPDLSAIPLTARRPSCGPERTRGGGGRRWCPLGDRADHIVLHPADDTLEWERRPGRHAKPAPRRRRPTPSTVAPRGTAWVIPQSLERLQPTKKTSPTGRCRTPRSGARRPSCPRIETTDPAWKSSRDRRRRHGQQFSGPRGDATAEPRKPAAAKPRTPAQVRPGTPIRPGPPSIGGNDVGFSPIV